jgi:hypothetical protein
MSIVKIFYQCQCGDLLKVEDRNVMDAAFAMQAVVIDHEDEACG